MSNHVRLLLEPQYEGSGSFRDECEREAEGEDDHQIALIFNDWLLARWQQMRMPRIRSSGAWVTMHCDG
jgi:hypothetical protein